MATRAVLRYVRISPYKVRLVAAGLRGMPIEHALQQLSFRRQKAAGILKKVIESAVANAEHNDSADVDLLRIQEIRVDQGSVLKRIRPRARGRAYRILKKTSHVMVTVAEAG
ncbi:MAG: 50S ribosomal protein L22 [Gammaproteobacteria bacterium]|nr:50S ribosomal protein L22 [Gammaproteobacteria bacterium]MDD9824958.1 50S ribosomal protein L22 [Gammaproteobacteria bacterium]